MKKTTGYLSLIIILATVALTACSKKQTHATYEGVDISRNAKIIRDKITKNTELQINVNESWKLFAGNTVENIDFSTPVFEGNGSGTFPINVNDSVRSYFQLITKNGKAILAEQHLPMAGGYNFRDLGGIKTSEGKYVKWGKIFRADELANLTESDLNYLSSIPINMVIDFRSHTEADHAPDKLPDNASYHHLAINPGNSLNVNTGFDLQNTDFIKIMVDMNRMLVSDSACIVQYKEFFRLLQNEQDVPLIFHCSAGKDRTGMAAALTLYALGVNDQTIMDNYLLSNNYLDGKYTSDIKQYPMIEPMMIVKPEYLQAGIGQIRKEYGTIENYLTNVLDVDIQEMKKTFLY